jgi:hypothetical protein
MGIINIVMFSFSRGTPLCLVQGGKSDGKILSIASDDNCCINHTMKCSNKKQCCINCSVLDDKSGDIPRKEISISDDGIMVPILNMDSRTVEYICGPSGCGKSTMAGKMIKVFHKLNPDKPIIVFSRTLFKDDPALKDIPMIQVDLDQLKDFSLDITKDIPMGTMVLFDDTNTIQDSSVQKIVNSIMEDIMEVGRKLKLYIIVTSHLIIPNSKKLARTVLNECQYLTVFPKSGNAQQIQYALKTYFGFGKKDCKKIMESKSRWVRISKCYPQYIMSDRVCYIKE